MAKDKRIDEIKKLCEENGLEVIMGCETHITLNTKTKLNCGCFNAYGEDPNTNVCPVCTGQPGSMPSLNKEAVKKGILLGKVLNAEISQNFFAERKHYFYPDLPSAFQRSQFTYPLIKNGVLQTYNEYGKKIEIKIHEAHIEEDSGKLIHQDGKTLIDFNRAGRPLIEIVTEPEIYNIEDLIAYLKALQRLVQKINISEADMQKGFFKADISVSLRKKGDNNLNPRTEIKNMNSFKFIKDGVIQEILRQLEYYKQNGEFKQIQETATYDVSKHKIKIMRIKESSDDYRYMREPNIPLINIKDLIKEVDFEGIIPFEIENKLIEAGVDVFEAQIFADDYSKFNYIQRLYSKIPDWKFLVKVFVNNLAEIYENLGPERLLPIIENFYNKKINSQVFSKILENLIVDKNFDREKFIQELKVDDNEVKEVLEQIIEQNSKLVEKIKSGDEKKIDAIVGMCMGRFKGKILDAQKLKKMVQEILLG